MNKYQEITNKIKSAGLFPAFKSVIDGVNEPICTIDNEEYLVFCANNYLGLTQNDKVKEAAIKAIKKFGVGPGGSRVISGNVKIIEDLEKRIAELTQTEDCLTFPTGYMANISAFSAVMDSIFDTILEKNDTNKHEGATIFSDEYNHGSIVDGCRLSSAKKVIFKHNDLDDLRNKIINNNTPKKMIVTEGVFSLEGEIINIPEYVKIAKDNNALLMVDDAHGVGLLGKNGGGIGEYFSCSKDIDILMGCMDKAFGGTGGYLCGQKSLVEFLRISCRSSLLSSALPTGMAGAMIESVNQIESFKGKRKELFAKAKYIKDELTKMGFTVKGKDNIPAVPLLIGPDELGVRFEKMLMDDHIYLPVVRWPAVPFGTSRFRIILMIDHSEKQLNHFLGVCKKIGKELSII